ncbi:MAG: HAD-IA family hydrolase [Paracoccus sp. (in: a-proteobacteria)]|nr:HAD-IA family hydrolase [Paracoccus sp. (in: a-proteobacteria)]
MTLSLAIFDVDGTLIDSQHHIHGAMRAAFAAEGLTAPDLAAVRRIVGLSLPVAMAELAPGHDPEPLVAAYKDAFITRRMREDAPLFTGALDCLDALAGHDALLLGVATGKGRRGLDAMVDLHGLHGRFATIQTADGNPSKPHPEMLLKALSETGTEAGRAVMVGDTVFDIEMARAAGVAGWGVAWGYHEVAALHDAGAARVFSDFTALTQALLRWHQEADA